MRRYLPPLVLMSLLAAGCGAEESSTAETAGAEGSPGLQVVAAVYPLAWVAEQVAPDVEVTLLNQGGQEAHDLEISPPQRAAIETADVVLYTGDIDYQPQVEEAVSAAEGQVVSATEVAGEDALLAAAEDAHAHEDEGNSEEESHGEEEGHSDEEGEEAHSEEEALGEEEAHADEAGGTDPHLWFDDAVMADLAVAVGAAFAEADPDNAATYEQNAADVRAQMETLGEDLDATLGGQCTFDEAIVSHAAYAYLLQPYGIGQHAVTNVGAESDASAGELAEIVGEIEAEGFTHVLAEPVEGRDGAEALVAETDVELLEIAPLDAVTDEQAETGFPDLVRAQAESFATALGCE